MAKITQLPSASSAIADDVAIISNATNGTRKITMSNLYNSMKNLSSITFTEVSDANDAVDPTKIYRVLTSTGLNVPYTINQSGQAWIINNICTNSDIIQIAHLQFPSSSTQGLYRRMRQRGTSVNTWHKWSSINEKYTKRSNNSTYIFNNFCFESVGYIFGLMYGAQINNAFLYLICIAPTTDSNYKSGNLYLYKVYDNVNDRTFSGTYENNIITINCNMTVYGGLTLNFSEDTWN